MIWRFLVAERDFIKILFARPLTSEYPSRTFANKQFIRRREMVVIRQGGSLYGSSPVCGQAPICPKSLHLI